MPKSEIFVAGASAGGTDALRDMVAGLPRDFGASILAVVHIGKGFKGDSFLPDILEHAGPLPAQFAINGQQVEPGRIYLARPDLHMALQDGQVRVFYGPKENLTRPAINPLFRSAAAAYGNRAAGIILSGNLDDGVAGLAEIKRRGGIAVVQDPATAQFRGMPESALEYVDADYVLAPKEMGRVIARLAGTDHAAGEETDSPLTQEPLRLNCPECGGPLWAQRRGRITEYGCRVGHSFSPLALSHGHDIALERALWSAILELEESAEIDDRPGTLQRTAAAGLKRKEAGALRKMLDDLHDMKGPQALTR